MAVPSYWREIPQRYRLEAGKCKKCGKIHFPPRLVCVKCGSKEFETVTLQTEGKVETYTVIHVAPSQFTQQVPYALGVVKLKDGVSILAQITDCEPDELKIGMPVKVFFEDVTDELTLPKFEPAR